MTEEEMDLDVVSYDASPFEIVLNNNIRVAGTLSVSMEKNDTPPDPLSDEPYRSIIIRGMLATKYFEQDIEKIETRRYSVTGVEVYSEEFGSLEDEIVYKFLADAFRVKYQLSEPPEERMAAS